MGWAGLGKPPDAVRTTELICQALFHQENLEVRAIALWTRMALETSGFGDKWRDVRAAEVGHVVGEANDTWDTGRICTEFGSNSQGGGGSVEGVVSIDHILIYLFCRKLGGGGGIGGCGANLGHFSRVDIW